MKAQLLAICTGQTASLLIPSADGKGPIHKEISGIRKTAVSTLQNPTSIACSTLGLIGDEHGDLTVHGGLNKAVYCYPFEHYAFWKEAFPWLAEKPSLFGQVGENLCVAGLLEQDLWLGDQLQIGEDVLLRIVKTRQPCYKFNAHMRSDQASKLMSSSGRFGWYCSVLKEGKIRAGDDITLTAGAREIKLLDT